MKADKENFEGKKATIEAQKNLKTEKKEKKFFQKLFIPKKIRIEKKNFTFSSEKIQLEKMAAQI